ncbi:hypothetical protein GT347_20165 [Xylophilus rhododendri]|uniref:Ribbon-helix-helix protein CopG domain-containing protein n=1 Tax=Xylophilus rhododendri TaxID=2697032 RepID=A0A857J7S4_9BURK|nr:hypothetical protein [Xylophilus rhododendri]QHJ00091.1 hypothetical protein GT347_20165 [Xylophilus rhododendri]
MYADPTHIRAKRVNLSLNETEDRMAEAAAEFNGMQKSAYLRELVLEGLRRVHGGDSQESGANLRALAS